MTLLDDIRAELKALELLSRRKGRVTLRMVDEALRLLPPSAQKLISLHHHKTVCDALNAALDDADPATIHDTKAKAAGDA